MNALEKLQDLIRAKDLDGYLVPRADCFFGEEVRACDDRLAFLTGFDGSAGNAVVMADGPGHLLVDGRYTAQAKDQTQATDWSVSLDTVAKVAQTHADMRFGFDPWLMSQALHATLDPSQWIALPDNLVDQVWKNRPAPKREATQDLPLDLSGEASADKRRRILAACEGRDLLICQPDALAWLLNWRGSDLMNSPLSLAFGVLRQGGVVEVFYPEQRYDLLAALATGQVQFDPATTSYALVTALGDRGTAKTCPIRAAKAQKNAAEIAAMRAAHAIDGQAVSAFLKWYEGADQTRLTELDLVTKLTEFRRQNAAYAGPSFETICGSGPNGALPHYRVNAQSNRYLCDGDFIVLDSGGQYPGATTDVTRTLAVGRVSDGMRRDFTLVLKGMIDLTCQQFPAGTTGHQLDVLARAALWNAGLNYNHGTGHGVGAGLHVHEAPPNVSARATTPAADWALRPGMIFSNEPGLYLEGAYGIRIENLLLVVERTAGWLGFETLTQIPIDERLVDFELLTPSQASWLRANNQDL